MDAKYVISKTAFYLAIVGSIVVFTMVFGEQNVLVGVTIAMAALMMLAIDMSARPVKSFAVVLALNMSLGVGSFVALLNPWLGLVVNFAVVFGITYTTMHDLRSPMYFPFILGYVFILSMPVEGQMLYLRFAGLAIGSVAIVLLNVIVNRKKYKTTCHSSISSLFADVKAITEKKISGEEIDLDVLRKKCSAIDSVMSDRLKYHYKSTPGNRSVISLASSIEELGRTIARADHSESDLKDLAVLIGRMSDYEDGKCTLDEMHSDIDTFVDSHRSMDSHVVSCLRVIDYELMQISVADDSAADSSGDKIPESFRFKTLLKENINKNSVKFTFAFRLALLIAAWEFVADYFNIADAKWLAFTSIAIVQPYLEGTFQKSKERVYGTVLGVGVFAVTMAIIVGLSLPQSAAVTAVLMAVAYGTTLKKPETYSMTVLFNTMMALMSASLLEDMSVAIVDRLAFIGIGIVVAMLANHLIFPFRFKNERYDLTKKAMSVGRAQIQDLEGYAKGTSDKHKAVALTISSDSVANKLRSINTVDTDDNVEAFVVRQNEISSRCMFLRSMLSMDDSLKATVAKVLGTSDDGTPKMNVPSDLSAKDRAVVNDISDIVGLYERNQTDHEKIAAAVA